MKSLIVYAHPEPKSFNGALKDKAVETLEAQGYEVKVSVYTQWILIQLLEKKISKLNRS